MLLGSERRTRDRLELHSTFDLVGGSTLAYHKPKVGWAQRHSSLLELEILRTQRRCSISLIGSNHFVIE